MLALSYSAVRLSGRVEKYKNGRSVQHYNNSIIKYNRVGRYIIIFVCHGRRPSNLSPPPRVSSENNVRKIILRNKK